MKKEIKNLVSVVIPTYNRSREVLRAIRSVQNQSYDNIEIIIVDDNSHDSTKSDINRFIDKNKQSDIRYILNRKNLGNGESRNVGIKACKGEYIAFLDDDDIWMPEKIMHQLMKIKSSRKKVCFCGTVWRSEGKILKKTVNINREVSFEHGGPTSTWLLHRSVFQTIGFFDSSFPSCVDGEFLVRLNKNYKSCVVKEYLYVHFYHLNQISSNNLAKIQGFENLIEKHRGSFNNHEMGSALFRLVIFYLYNNKKKFSLLFESILFYPEWRNISLLIIFLFPKKMSIFLLNKVLDLLKYPKSFAGRYRNE